MIEIMEKEKISEEKEVKAKVKKPKKESEQDMGSCNETQRKCE